MSLAISAVPFSLEMRRADVSSAPSLESDFMSWTFGNGSAEVWRSPLPVRRGAGFAANGEVLLGTLERDGAGIEPATRAAYGEILDLVRREGYPHLLRIWNYVGGINEGEGDAERYRLFCAGRHDAFATSSIDRLHYPSASAVGFEGSGLRICFLAAREPGIQVENPRQVSAYDYPREYGRRSPSFARATVASWNGESVAFIAGTSSVVGHETVHIGDARAQLEETLRNLAVIIERCATVAGTTASLERAEAVKVYVRRGTDPEPIARRVREAIPPAQMLVLEADICRQELLLEIEAIVRL